MRKQWIGLAAMAGLLLAASAGLAQDDSRPRGGRMRVRRSQEHLKNSPEIRALLKAPLARASWCAVRVLCEGKPVALGTSLGEGRIVTKASLLTGGKIACILPDKRTVEAVLVGQDEATDLALLRVDAPNLLGVTWRQGEAPAPGTIVAAAGPDDTALAVGVISDRPQDIPGSTRPTGQAGFLGVSLSEDENGTEIQSVTPDSGAAKAGLLAGDRFKRIDGREVKALAAVAEAIQKVSPGKTIRVVVQRGEKEVEVVATVGRQDGGPGRKLPQDNWGGGPFSERRRGFPLVLPNDLAIAPGDCGGPLADIEGKVVGVNIARALRVTTYALPAQVVQDTVEKLLRRQAESRPAAGSRPALRSGPGPAASAKAATAPASRPAR